MNAEEFLVELYKRVEEKNTDLSNTVLSLRVELEKLKDTFNKIKKYARVSERGFQIYVPNYGGSEEDYNFVLERFGKVEKLMDFIGEESWRD